jgi:hypothetical protein
MGALAECQREPNRGKDDQSEDDICYTRGRLLRLELKQFTDEQLAFIGLG